MVVSYFNMALFLFNLFDLLQFLLLLLFVFFDSLLLEKDFLAHQFLLWVEIVILHIVVVVICLVKGNRLLSHQVQGLLIHTHAHPKPTSHAHQFKIVTQETAAVPSQFIAEVIIGLQVAESVFIRWQQIVTFLLFFHCKVSRYHWVNH